MAKHFIGVENYVISPTWKPPRKKRYALLGLAALYMLRKNKSGSGGRKNSISYSKTDTRQRCTVKMHYSYNIKAHQEQINRYLTKEGKGKEGETPSLYGSSVAEYKKNMVEKNVRIFLSPSSDKIPLTALTKKFIEQLEKQTGYELSWVAAEHYDTAHPHSHILINGVDKKGKDVFFPPDLVRTFMRENARNICTKLIGSRTKEDMKREREGLIESHRFTFLDKDISERLEDNTYTLKGFEKESVKNRFDYLTKLNLCSVKYNTYTFIDGWEEKLKINGRYNSFLSSRQELQKTDKQNLKLYQGDPKEISGTITKIYKTDDVSENHAILLETEKNTAYFVPLFYKPFVQEGEKILIEGIKNQKGRLTPKIMRYRAAQNTKERGNYEH